LDYIFCFVFFIYPTQVFQDGRDLVIAEKVNGNAHDRHQDDGSKQHIFPNTQENLLRIFKTFVNFNFFDIENKKLFGFVLLDLPCSHWFGFFCCGLRWIEIRWKPCCSPSG
jgi:hypothetical protein